MAWGNVGNEHNDLDELETLLLSSLPYILYIELELDQEGLRQISLQFVKKILDLFDLGKLGICVVWL